MQDRFNRDRQFVSGYWKPTICDDSVEINYFDEFGPVWSDGVRREWVEMKTALELPQKEGGAR